MSEMRLQKKGPTVLLPCMFCQYEHHNSLSYFKFIDIFILRITLIMSKC